MYLKIVASAKIFDRKHIYKQVHAEQLYLNNGRMSSKVITNYLIKGRRPR